MKKIWLGILIFLQLIVIVTVAKLLIFNEKQEIVYSPSDINFQYNINGEHLWNTKHTGLGRGSHTLQMEYIYSGESGSLYFTDDTHFTTAIHKSSSINIYNGHHVLETDCIVTEGKDLFSVLIVGEAGSDITIESLRIVENSKLGISCLSLVLFVSVCVDIFVIYRCQILLLLRKKEVLLMLLICIISSIPLFLHYLLVGHDLIFHLNRIEGIYISILNMEIPSRINTCFLEGRGYPTGIYYPELFLYIPAILRLLGVSLMDSYKILLFLINVLTVINAYLCGKLIFKDKTYGIMLSMFYTLMPYRLVCLYLRAAVGEVLAMAFFPLLVAGIVLLLQDEVKENRKCICSMLIISVTGIMQSHILSCIMCLIFGILAMCICYKKFFHKERIICIISSIIIFFGLNAWTIVPFLAGRNLDLMVNNYQSGNIYPYTITITELFSLFPTINGTALPLWIGIAGEMPLYPGIIVMGSLFFFAGVWLCKGHIKDSAMSMGKIFWILGSIALVMTTVIFPWYLMNYIPIVGNVLNMVQFPWRFLGIASLFLFLAGLCGIKVISDINMRKNIIISSGIISIVLALWICQSTTTQLDIYEVYDKGGLDVYGIMGQEYLYQGTKLEDLREESNREDWYVQNGTNVICQIENLQEKAEYRLPLLYYPWYVAKDTNTGEVIEIIKGENNIAFLDIPVGYSGTVEVTFEEPMLWKVANVISLATFISLLIYFFIKRRRKV